MCHRYSEFSPWDILFYILFIKVIATFKSTKLRCTDFVTNYMEARCFSLRIVISGDVHNNNSLPCNGGVGLPLHLATDQKHLACNATSINSSSSTGTARTSRKQVMHEDVPIIAALFTFLSFGLLTLVGYVKELFRPRDAKEKNREVG